MNVSNRKCVRTLARRSLRASRTRNLIAVLAIALTTVLFTSLFTIALSINDGFQQNNFRQVGGYSHGGFKYLTEAQYEALKDDPLIDLDTIGLKGSPTNVYNSFSPPVKGAGLMLEGSDKGTCDKLAALLDEKHLI